MKRGELVRTPDPDTFRDLLSRAKISDATKYDIVCERADWLWQEYRPTDEAMEYIRSRMK
jgi:hypothetical protein